MKLCSAIFLVLLPFSLAAPPCVSLAQPSSPKGTTVGQSDGIYGRFDGELSLYGGAGALLRLEDGNLFGAASLELNALVLDAAGPFFAIDFAPKSADQVALGVQLRPLFPARFFLNAFSENPFLDRTIESIHLEIGAGLRSLHNDTEVGVLAGAGLDIPLTPPMARWGAVLRLGARYLRIRADQQNGGAEQRHQWTLRATFLMFGRVRLRQ